MRNMRLKGAMASNSQNEVEAISSWCVLTENAVSSNVKAARLLLVPACSVFGGEEEKDA